jgi:acetyl-CoA decarbonylase/synthase complex subunit epsilon
VTTTLPFHVVNTLAGTKSARLIEDAAEYAHLIKRASRPLLVIGARAVTTTVGGKPFIDYAVEITKAVNVPICATAHAGKKLQEMGYPPASTYDLIEIINHLKDPAWHGVKNEGNHDLIIFLGIRADLAEQGLSTLKHFAPHLKTMTLCKYYYPNASYSLPNFRKDEKWQEFLDAFIADLKKAD